MTLQSPVTIETLLAHTDRVAVVGLGYVGLPLAVHLAEHFAVTGYDLDETRIDELRRGRDRTREVEEAALAAADLRCTADPTELSGCRFIIVAVPTPIDAHRIPNLTPLRSASQTVGTHMRPGTCVVFESTVFPGATEEICVPLMEAASGYTLGVEFTVGYSPERINPGDKAHTVTNIVKVVAGFDESARELLCGVYGRIVTAGLHRASSIRVAEAAKVIENTQRDLNIALMNELAMIFNRMEIDTLEVLEAAGTKWNFLPYRPGLVGGHCIGVDPYYLTFKAESIGYHPEMILAGRRINDHMGKFVAERTLKRLIRAGRLCETTRVAVLGLTFKENVPDLRNTRVIDIVKELTEYDIDVKVHDPLADPAEAADLYNIRLVSREELQGADAVILAVAHDAFRRAGFSAVAGLCAPKTAIVIDIKGVFHPDDASKENASYWRL